MQGKREKVECYEEWMEMINKMFSIVEVKGFMIKDFVTGLGMPFFKKVVTHEGLKFKITKYSICIQERVKIDMEADVGISGLLCEKSQPLRPGLPTVPLPIQPLYTFMLPANPAKVDVLRLKKYETNEKSMSSACSINHDTDNDG
jgi:hypothetical protein